MSVMIKCTCGRQFGVMERHVGKKGRCPHCGTVMLLQAEGGAAPAPAADKKKSSPDEAAPSRKGGGAPAPARPDKSVDPAGKSKAKAAKDKPASAHKGAAAPAPQKVDADKLVEMRTGAAPVSSTGEADMTSQMAGIRHIVQRFCPVCGARYNEGAARCSHCHAPLSPEEIAAAEAAKKPPLFPWMPQIHLSTNAKRGAVLLGILAVVGIVYLFMLPSLNRKARLQTELTLVEKTLTGAKAGSSVDPLLYLTLDMPRFPWHRPATVRALGQWERRSGAGAFPTAGAGTYDLEKRELVLKAAEGLQYRVVAPPVLHMAAKAGDISFVRRLLNEGCNVNEKDAQGATALHAAAAADGDQVDLVQLLKDKGAIVAATDDKGLTPAAVARAHKNAKVVRVLGGGPALEPGV